MYNKRKGSVFMNSTAKTLKIFSILIGIVGFIVACIAVSGEEPANWVLFLSVLVVSAFACVTVYGFGELIDLTDSIKKQICPEPESSDLPQDEKTEEDN